MQVLIKLYTMFVSSVVSRLLDFNRPNISTISFNNFCSLLKFNIPSPTRRSTTDLVGKVIHRTTHNPILQQLLFLYWNSTLHRHCTTDLAGKVVYRTTNISQHVGSTSKLVGSFAFSIFCFYLSFSSLNAFGINTASTSITRS